MELDRTVPWDHESHCWGGRVPDELERLYSSYSRELGVGGSCAVLVIDVYELAFDGGDVEPVNAATTGAGCGIFAQHAREPLGRLLELARESAIPLHFTAMTAETGAATHRANDDRDGIYEFEPDFAPRKDESVVVKERASAFYGTPLASRLVQQGVDTVIMCGNTTSGCVRASAVDAQSHGFHAVIAEDATFDRATEPHIQNMFDLHHKYADCLSVAALEKLLR